MANELFTRTEVNFGGAMHAQKGLLVPNRGLTGILMQNLQLQYAQSVNRIYEIGIAGQTTNVYYISGRAQGNVSSNHIVGPGTQMKAFYDNFGDVCSAGQNDLAIVVGPDLCQGSTQLSYTAKFCVLVNVGLAFAAQDFVINTNSNLMFSGLEVVVP
jgi:hypothetical protein